MLTSLLLYVASACRFKVSGWLAKRFRTPADAESHYFPALAEATTVAGHADVGTQTDFLDANSDVAIQTDKLTPADVEHVTETTYQGKHSMHMP